MIGFMEFCGWLLILMVFTQIILPLFFPKSFHFFWLFRKKKVLEKVEKIMDLKDEVEQAKVLKKSTEQTVKEIRKKTRKHLKDAEKLHNELEN